MTSIADSWVQNLVPMKIFRVEGLMHVKSVEAQTSARWCGVEDKRGWCQLGCRSRHLLMVQNYEVRRSKSLNVAE
ncbi:hypothetical protein TNCV_4495931 [Trichonephila clavipes]|nr:hypothetical protein TNCV_4495931 [Trichonephila clavipes]